MPRFTVLSCYVLVFACAHSLAQEPVIFRHPTLSKTHIVFEHAGDLWSVPRAGGSATRLTAGPGVETHPVFSPDGMQVAFTGEYDGNVDAYVVPAAGGVPKRLTWHPAPDTVLGWTPDGKRVLFTSPRTAYSRFAELFTIALDAGPEERLPLPMGFEGAISPDGKKIAYVPISRATAAWKRYRGGMATPVWIATLENSHIEKTPRADSNDFNPMWAAGRVWFLSDRDGAVTLYSFDPKTRKVTRAVENKGMDFKSASAGPDAIVIEQFGSLHLFEWKSGKMAPVNVTLSGDMPELRERLVKVASRLRAPFLSPNGVRVAFEARGEIITVPAEKGDARNLTSTMGVMERDPAWSPDGKSIAFFSDESGEYQLHLASQDGKGGVTRIALAAKPSFYFAPRWSPDSRKIAYVDAHLGVWYVDVDSRKPTRVDQDRYLSGVGERIPAWSPDSKWLAYTKHQKNYLGAVYLYSLADGTRTQVTDGMSDARDPVFDKGGKYLYFSASTDSGASLQPDIHSFTRPVSRSVYLAVLSKDEPSPLAPQSDEEQPADEKKPDAAKTEDAKPDAPKPDGAKPAAPAKTPDVKIDIENILQRVLALPMPPRRYVSLQAGKAGTLLALESPAPGPGSRPGLTVHRYDLKERRSDVPIGGVTLFQIAHNGEKTLYRQGEKWMIGTLRPMPPSGSPAPPTPPPDTAAKALNVDGLEVRISPRDEWKQMYKEAWRIQREFFYDPGLHGLNLADAEKKYEKYLAALASRRDLNYIFGDMLGEISVGHLFAGGGEAPEVKRVQTGLLGADYEVADGRYRFKRIYNGENWNPQLRAPLTQPGVNVRIGDYLLAVNGSAVNANDSVYRLFEATAGKQTVIRVGRNANGDGARDVTVVPEPSEQGLRNLAWIEDNRRKVDQMTQGRVAYIYMPDTAFGGLNNFNRYFFAQVGKEAAIVDERFNGGGMLATDIAELLSRKRLSQVATRDGEDEVQPQGAIFGPKVMLINEFAGSGGDAMPWYFRRAGVGRLIGKRTWGGLVGRAGAPQLMDGGFVSAPSSAVWDPASSKWIAENVGVEPDIEVEHDPELVRQGKDPQLEKAVALLMTEMGKQPPAKPRRPAFPNYHSSGGAPGPDTANATRR
ncbi:MAG: PDZ domain-containing protein [Bryobacteraceae bacterium]